MRLHAEAGFPVRPGLVCDPPPADGWLACGGGGSWLRVAVHCSNHKQILPVPQVWKRACVRGLVGGVGVARPQRRRVRMSQVLRWQRRLLVAAIALACPVSVAEPGAELLVCGAGNVFDCNGGDADTSAASQDLRGCIQPVEVIQFAPTSDTVVAHNNLAYTSCNPRDNGGGLWNDCQGTESRFCKVGANTAIGEIEAIGHIDAHGSPPADNQVTGVAQWLGGEGKHYDDPDECSPAELADPNQESCINGFDFIGRNNDDCMEGMVFDNASPDLDKLPGAHQQPVRHLSEQRQHRAAVGDAPPRPGHKPVHIGTLPSVAAAQPGVRVSGRERRAATSSTFTWQRPKAVGPRGAGTTTECTISTTPRGLAKTAPSG